jgi:hypothetical protein
VRVVVAFIFWLLPTAVFAQTEKRIALLIGNRAYDTTVGALKNPHNDTVSNSVDNRPQEASNRGGAVQTSMLLVGILVAGVSLLHLPTSLMSQANTQVEAGPPIVKASDKWIRLGVDASSSQVPTALDQPPAMSW